jgi:hypothetical protein
VAILGGCDALVPEPDAALPIANLDLEPKPGQLEPMMPTAQGPVIEVASGAVGGEDFTLTLYRSAEGFCLALSAIQYRGAGCGPPPGEGAAELERFAIIGESGLADGTVEIDGMVAADVERVWVVTDHGHRAHAELIPAGLDGLEASIFLVFLPAGTVPTTIVAADGTGGILEELPILSVAPGGPAAPPTPGG